MRFVRQPEEIRRIMSTLSNARFDEARTLAATFRTTSEFVRDVLPPPLQPASEPLGTIAVISVGRSNCVGPFQGGFVSIRARYNDLEAEYCLAMTMDTDTAIIFGREIFGEPKKQAKSQIDIKGDKVVGSIERQGVEVVNISGSITGQLDPGLLSQSDMLHFKYSINPDGSGLDYDPRLVRVHFKNTVRSARLCEVKVQLRGTPDDVYGDIPVEAVLGGMLADLDHAVKVSYLTQIDRQVFLPYAFSKFDQYDRYYY
jgi:acetoacetate decarboxylase